MVIPTYWNFPGIILNDETYLFWQVSLFFLPANTIPLEGKNMGIGELMAISIVVSMDAFAIAICKGLSVTGVRIGNHFGAKYKSRAEVVGGIVLILIGTLILAEHLWT